MTKYCMDTSSFLEGASDRPYAMGYFDPLWSNFDVIVKEGLLSSPYLVLMELKNKEDEMYNWVKDRREILFKQPSQEVQEVGDIVDNFPKFVREHKNKPYWADPEVIALAKVENLTVVTQEEWNPAKPEKYKIPNVCKHYNVEYIKFIELIKRENLTGNIEIVSKHSLKTSKIE